VKVVEIDSLAKFEKAEISDLEKYGVGQALQDTGHDDRQGLSLFGGLPQVYLTKNNIKLTEDIRLDGLGGVYIIDGSLTVEASLVFTAADSYTVLVVTGNLIVSKDFVQQMDTQLIVLGDTQISGIMWIDVSDAGFSVFRGKVSVNTWAQANDSVEKSLFFTQDPNGRKLEYNWKEGSEYRKLYEKFSN
jgi:hypothetical protein